MLAPTCSKRSPNALLQTVLSLGLLGAASYVVSIAMIKTAHLSGQAVILWPIEGIALAAMLGWLRGHPYLALLVVRFAAIAAGAYCKSYPPFYLSIAPVYFVATASMYFFLNRYVSTTIVDSSKNLLKFTTAAALVSFFVSWPSGFLLNHFFHIALLPVVVTTATSNFVGLLVITPLISIISSSLNHRFADGTYNIRTAGLIALFAVTNVAIFTVAKPNLVYIIPLALFFLAYVTDVAVVAVAVSLTVAIAMTCTFVGLGPFYIPVDVAKEVIPLQIFLVVTTMTALPVSAVMAEHRRLKQSLIAARTEAELASQSKSMFLAMISHEVRTPLNGVLGMAQILAADELTPLQRERVDVVRASGETLMALLNDVLDLSKIEAGKLTLETIEFDFGALMRGAFQTYAQIGQEKGLTLVLDLGDAEGIYRGDPTRIRQILSNLISNALKFTEHGRIDLTAFVDPQGLNIQVTDTGIGIPADKLHRLFGKFDQVDNSTTRRFGGTGLGLSICRELAGLMGGKITVSSQFGVGTRFQVTLPLQRISEAAAAMPSDPCTEKAAQIPPADLKILAADDNATNRLVLKTLLQSVGLDAVIVADGAEAVEAWEGGDWDLILMDVQMPVLDGVAATRMIRAKERSLGRPRTPIIALTANAMAHQIADYRAAGMDDFVTKPIIAAALFAAIAQAGETGQTQTVISAVPSAS